MSRWTYVRGVVRVDVPGETQAQTTYYLQTVLAHQPRVRGSEEDMQVAWIIEPGYRNISSSHDELGNPYREREWGERQSYYNIVLAGSLRDTYFDDTYRQVAEWLCRLAKRVPVEYVLVSVDDDAGRSGVIHDGGFGCFSELYVAPSLSFAGSREGTINRFEHLLGWYDSDPLSGLPLTLAALDYDDPEIDAELERRREFREKRARELEEERERRYGKM